MAYEKLGLENGTVLTAEHVAHMEAAIENSGGVGIPSPGCSASGENAHAEGYDCSAVGKNAHSEGANSQATGESSHAEGNSTSYGKYSHAENQSTANGLCSHCEGIGTIASGQYQHVQGKYNVEDASGIYAHIVGNGTRDGSRTNAHTLDWNGVAWFEGRVQCLGSGQNNGSQTVMLNGDSEITLIDKITGKEYHLCVKNGALAVVAVEE